VEKLPGVFQASLLSESNPRSGTLVMKTMARGMLLQG